MLLEEHEEIYMVKDPILKSYYQAHKLHKRLKHPRRIGA
jgi:hypothetical protein